MSSFSRAVLEGIQHSNILYERWSKGWWITDSRVERCAVSIIMGKMRESLPKQWHIISELSFGHIKEWSDRQRPPGRPFKNINDGNLCDIVILNVLNGRPICVIEVKRQWELASCFSDLERTRNIVLECCPENNGSLRRGILTFLVISEGETKREAIAHINESWRDIRRTILDEFDPRGLGIKFYRGLPRQYPKIYLDDDDPSSWAHAPCCVELIYTA